MESISRNRNRRTTGNDTSQNGLRNFSNGDNYNTDDVGDETGPIEQEDEDEEEDDDAAISEMSERDIYPHRLEDLQEDDAELNLQWNR